MDSRYNLMNIIEEFISLIEEHHDVVSNKSLICQVDNAIQLIKECYADINVLKDNITIDQLIILASCICSVYRAYVNNNYQFNTLEVYIYLNLYDGITTEKIMELKVIEHCKVIERTLNIFNTDRFKSIYDKTMNLYVNHTTEEYSDIFKEHRISDVYIDIYKFRLLASKLV